MELPRNENTRDFNRKYQHTIVVDRTTGKDRLFIVGGLLENDSGSLVIKGTPIVDGPAHYGGKNITIPFHKFEASLDFPKLGVINVPNNILYFGRIPYRQWLRCFHNSLVHISYPQSEDGLITDINRGDVLHSIFFPKYFSEKEALAQLVSGDRISCAIDDRFYLGVSKHFTFIYVGYKENIIGKLTNKRKEISLFPYAKSLLESTEEAFNMRVTIGE